MSVGSSREAMNIRTNIEMQPYVELRRDEVARKALQLWKAAGRPTGRDLEYWLQAEVELLSERQHCRPHLARALDSGAPGKVANSAWKNAAPRVAGRNGFENLRSIAVNAST